MKINIIKLLFTLLFSLTISGCGSDVSVMMETESVPAAVPESHVVVSSHPPLGTYRVLAELSTEQRDGENVVEFKKRLQESGAKIGADYVMITSGSDNSYIAPAVSNTYSSANGFATAYPNYDGSATAYGTAFGDSTTYSTPAHTYVRTSVVAKALKMLSGINQPNMKVPSNLSKSR